MNDSNSAPVVIIGAGPAGLTAAYQLTKSGTPCIVLEADDVVGGISRTVDRDGWKFDIGGHRFFTKVPEVEALWHEILDDEDFLLRPRMSRIYYDGKFYDYPLKAMNALRNLGPIEALRCVASYAWVRVRPPHNQDTFEGWVASRFGWRLYRTFFKTYTEKVWGVPADELQADFAAQRIKNLSLSKAIINAILPKRNQKDITSLIEEFQYPKFGPGMMWERCTAKAEAAGARIVMNARVTNIEHQDGRAIAVTASVDGEPQRFECSEVISSMPMPELLTAMSPSIPTETELAAKDLQFRDFLTVSLVVSESCAFPDNWIYIHAPDVQVGRIQNFGSWSPFMVKDGYTCLGLEYFVFEGDTLWNAPDEDLISMATTELRTLGLLTGEVEFGYVVRMPKAYPTYDERYRDNVETLRGWLDKHAANVHPVGRNGMHKYNNQDHSMFTAMLTVENIVSGTSHDIWSVNVEAEYHEEVSSGTPSATGRDAPMLAAKPTR